MSIARISDGREGAILIDATGKVTTTTNPGGGGTTSVWSPADAAANGMTLTNGGLTVTPSGATSWQTIRSSISKASGKLYVEFLNSGVMNNPSQVFGLASSSFINSSYLGSSNYSAGMAFNGAGTLVSTGFSSLYNMPIVSLNVNDVVSLWVDFGAGLISLAKNNAGFNSGNPIASFVPATVGALFAGISFNSQDGVGVGVWTLQATAASQKYAPPTGFSAWDTTPAQAYLARTVGGNEGGNAANITALIDGLVADGVWAKLDALYVLAQQNEADAKLNLIGVSYPLTQTGALLEKPAPQTGTLVFTPYMGFYGFFTSNSYLDTGFTFPATNFTQNSASLGIWTNTIYSEPSVVFGDGITGGSSHIYPYFTDNNFYARVNSQSTPGVVAPAGIGLFVGDRPSSTSVVLYYNGASRLTTSDVSLTPVTGQSFRIGAIVTGSHQQFAAAFIGASLGASGQLALYNRLRTYMTAVGVP